MSATGPPISFQLGEVAVINGTFRDLAGALYDPTTVTFKTKAPDDVVAAVTPTSQGTGLRRVEFLVDKAGTWLYEWTTTGSADRQPGSFEVLYSPLDEPSKGRVERATQTILGLTWARLENAQWYGIARLQQRVEAAKYRWAAVVAATDESAYPIVLVDYLAKRSALEIIPAGVEYWMDQKVSQSSTGTNESIERFGNRQKALTDLAERLERECDAMMDDPALVTYLSSNDVGPDVSDGSDSDLGMTTASPYDFPPAFKSPSDFGLMFPLGE